MTVVGPTCPLVVAVLVVVVLRLTVHVYVQVSARSSIVSPFESPPENVTAGHVGSFTAIDHTGTLPAFVTA